MTDDRRRIDIDTPRDRFIGGSDIAAVCGFSPWRSALEVWQEKTGVAPQAAAHKPQLARGKLWEQVVREMLEARLTADGVTWSVVTDNQRYARGVASCEIDFEIHRGGEVENVELKTVHPFSARQWGDDPDDVPVWYQAQLQWGLHVTGRQHGIIAALFGADELRCYPFDRDQQVITLMVERAEAFWDCVLSNTPPPPVTLADCAALWPRDNIAECVEANADALDALEVLRAAKEAAKANGELIEALEIRVKKAIGEAQGIRLGDRVLATWKTHGVDRVNVARLKSEAPELAKQYTDHSEVRTLRVK